MVPHVAARKTHQLLQTFSFVTPKNFCNNIGTFETCQLHRAMSAFSG